MRKYILFLLPLCMLVACKGLDGPEAESPGRADETVYHGMIELGQKLDDPYTVENMQKALYSVYSTKADRVDITETDLYVRFLPKDNEQFQQLQALGLYLMDHPMDYQILKEGDYYQDPEVGSEAITWQYAVVPHDFTFPEDIRYELIDKIFISEHVPVTRADEWVDWELVEKEAFRLTGNGELWQESATKADDAPPSGRITIEDPLFSGGKPFGVAGVKVAANIFVKVSTAYTDRDGYYKLGKKFSGKPRYRLVFQNTTGFNIGFNFLLVPASVSTLGKGEPSGMDLHVTQADSEGALFRRSVVNNAAYDYYSRCTPEDLDIPTPPGDLRIWIFPFLDCSSASMLHHGAFLDHTLIQTYLGAYLPLIKIFLPDITIGTKQMDYMQIYENVVHELAHATHYAQVGNTFWTPYIDYVIKSFITEGGRPYGSGNDDKAGYCEIGEMWGYFMQETLKKDRYGGTVKQFGNYYWFKPDLFSYLYERGLSRGEIFRALNSGLTSLEDLKRELITQNSDKEKIINDTFRKYGK